MIRKVRRIEALIEKDPIKGLRLRHDGDRGVQAEPIEINTQVITGQLQLGISSTESDGQGSFDPPQHSHGSFYIEPLDLTTTRWATILPLRVWHSEPEFRPKLNWVRKNDRTASSVFIVDKEHSEYYYPTSTDLGGELVADAPRTGLIAFEPFRQPTGSFELHFSGIRVSAKRGAKASFVSLFSDESLPQSISETLAKPSLVDQISTMVEQKQVEAREQIEAQAKQGCLVLVEPYRVLRRAP